MTPPILCPTCWVTKPCKSSVCEHPDLRQPPASGPMTLDDVRALIASDSYAIGFQSMAQYRTALLKALSPVWKPKCYIHSTRGWNGKTFGQECALHGPFDSVRQRHGEYDIPCPLAPEDNDGQ